MSPQAGDWAQLQHARCIAQPMLPDAHQPGLSNAAVAQQLGNVALATNRTNDDRAAREFLASQQPSTARSGFESFPTLTQEHLILHASARLDCGSTRTAPVASYEELLGFANTTFVRTHMHTYLRGDAHNCDIFISQGLCAAVKMASFLSNFSTRPGPFSLFSCITEPAEKSDLGREDDSLKMKLKLQDSSEGLSDKDIRGLTKVFHVAPATFVDLRSYLANFSSICTMVFGATSSIVTAIKQWSTSLATGGLQPRLRRLVSRRTAPCPPRSDGSSNPAIPPTLRNLHHCHGSGRRPASPGFRHVPKHDQGRHHHWPPVLRRTRSRPFSTTQRGFPGGARTPPSTVLFSCPAAPTGHQPQPDREAGP
jgi:hypothetical protein